MSITSGIGRIQPLLLGALCAVALAAGAGGADAHGGQFRAPGQGAPPGQGLGPAPVPQVITPGETWQTWWDLNRLNLLPDRADMVRGGPVTPSGEGEAVDPYEGWDRRRVVATREQAVPFLCRLLDPRQDVRDEIRAAALIALGKISLDGATRMFIVRYLRDEGANTLVRESAALAVGLLCRSRPEHQLPARLLDELRIELLHAVQDPKADARVRSFAALSLGLLGDQPSLRTGESQGGFVAEALWAELASTPKGVDLPVALLTAIGLQPRESVPVKVFDGLRATALGMRRPGVRLNARERSHAVTALARLDAPGVDTVLHQLLAGRRVDGEIRRAAYLGAARRAARVDGATRMKLAEAVADALDRDHDPVATGLGLVAAGRLLGADLEASGVDVLRVTAIPRHLFRAAEKGTVGERGYATLAIALAARGARTSGAALPFLAKAKALMLQGLETGRGDDAVRAAYAVGLGLLGVEEGVPPLLAVVADDGALPVLRGHAAVALGQIGRRKEECRSALRALMVDTRDVLLRLRAAFGLALLGDREVRDALLEELDAAKTEYHRSHVVIALGRLGDVGTVPRLMAYVQDEEKTELARALGVVALGLILDPEPRPSLMKLREDANFPAATQVLYSAFAIF